MSNKKSNDIKSTESDFEKNDSPSLSPSEYMRARHPDLFSDTEIRSAPRLPREVFEYHLDTLTNRRQEDEFEHFARRLAEKEICPNLIAQTGPVGGGDSKVDSETYPVAEQLAWRWYEGIGQEASHERWAFAFSTKKDWRPKVRSDVKKAVETKRDYKRIFFITSQFVRDQTRAKIEDELSNKYQVDIRILDRFWIVKSIYEHDLLHLAIETLNIEGFSETIATETGPNDIRRQKELEELEKQIADTERYKFVEYQLVEDALQAALLSRGLERPRAEIDGKFQRAERLSKKIGISQQELRVFYNWAWTAYWWYEDVEEFNDLYDHVEDLALGSIQATELELLSNLWNILRTAVSQGFLDCKKAKLAKRTKTVKAELSRLSADNQRPNNAAQAETNGLLVELLDAFASNQDLDDILRRMKEVLEKSIGLVEYPVTSIFRIIQELGNVLTDSLAYDELLDVVIEIAEQRSSEGKAGNLLLTRGQQKFIAGKKYDAIKLLGRAQQKLAKDEYKEDWVKSAVVCGASYEGIGLLWGARSNILMAANVSFSEFVKHGALPPYTLLLVQKLVWIELQLGRVPHILAFMHLASFVAQVLALDEQQEKKYLEERDVQDATLGILFLKADVSNLKWLKSLPVILREMGLTGSELALLYALGHEDYLLSEGYIPSGENTETIRNFFYDWFTQPVYDDLPDQPELILETKVVLRSYVLGCEVIVEADNNLSSIYLAEIILGALEAFLATSFDSEVIPYRSELRIVVQPSNIYSELPKYDEGQLVTESKLTLMHPKDLGRKNEEQRKAFRKWLQGFIVFLTFQIALVSDADLFVDRLIKDEDGIGRALIFSDIDLAMENLFGETPKFSLNDWKSETNKTIFLYKKTLPCNIDFAKDSEAKEVDGASVQFGEGEPPLKLFGIDNLKHKDRRILSLINVPLWDKAQWKATAYLWFPGQMPIMALGFVNIEAAKLIFAEWKNRLSQVDEENKLRIAVITGVDKRNPSHYTVIVSTNIKHPEKAGQNHFIIVSRINTMTPPDLENLNRFLTAYKTYGQYRLVPTSFKSETEISEPIWDHWIGKYELVVRQAWEIGENDPDILAIREDSNPIIPDGVKDAPVLKALQRFSKHKKRKRHKRG